MIKKVCFLLQGPPHLPYQILITLALKMSLMHCFSCEAMYQQHHIYVPGFYLTSRPNLKIQQ